MSQLVKGWIRKIFQVTLFFILFTFHRTAFSFNLPDPLGLIASVPCCFMVSVLMGYLFSFLLFGFGGRKHEE